MKDGRPARIAIMPARGGSKRIERKNIVDFCGRPLLTYPLAAARESGLFDLIHVSTETTAIAAIAAANGCPPDFLRDPALADDHTGILAVMRWVLERYAASGRHFDCACLLMATAPLIEAEDLRGGCALFDRHGGVRPVLAVTSLPWPVEWAMRLQPDGGLAFIEPEKSERRSQDLPKAYIDSGTFVFFPVDLLLAVPAAKPDYLGYLLPRHKAVDIDEREDLDLAELLYRGRRQPPSPLS
jgi:N-acylneuraminate cytidylyltransferase